MILSVSRRTDIPAFFSEWFFNRVKAGEVYVPGPRNEHVISRFDITPDVTDCIVFWSKNPRPMLDRLGELKDYHYFFQFTLNAYDRDIEPFVPPLEERIDTFVRLSDMIGKERVIWRYDPILLNDRYTADWHLGAISYIAERLRGRTEKCEFSFVDVYRNKNLSKLIGVGHREFSDEGRDRFLRKLCEIAERNGLVLATCAEPFDLGSYGIAHNRCIDPDLIGRITGCELKAIPRDDQRGLCGCAKCEDVGSYDTCPQGCIYCYANFRPQTVEEKCGRYDPMSPVLCGSIDPEADRVTERKVKSFRTGKQR